MSRLRSIHLVILLALVLTGQGCIRLSSAHYVIGVVDRFIEAVAASDFDKINELSVRISDQYRVFLSHMGEVDWERGEVSAVRERAEASILPAEPSVADPVLLVLSRVSGRWMVDFDRTLALEESRLVLDSQ